MKKIPERLQAAINKACEGAEERGYMIISRDDLLEWNSLMGLNAWNELVITHQDAEIFHVSENYFEPVYE